MYALAQESGHTIWKEWWYAFTLGASLQTDLSLICNDQVFVVNVVVTAST
jgi:hypothetical protein